MRRDYAATCVEKCIFAQPSVEYLEHTFVAFIGFKLESRRMASKENAYPLDLADFQLSPKKKPRFTIHQDDDDKYNDIVSSLNLDICSIIFAVV